MPNRIKLSRQKGWRKPAGAIVVARPTRWGNHWRVTEWMPAPGIRRWSLWDARTGVTKSQHETRADAIRSAVQHFRADLEHEVSAGLTDLTPLIGADLACWCSLNEPCHADILLAVANGEVMERALIFDQPGRRISGTGGLIRLGDGSIDIALRHPIRIEYRRNAG